MRLKHTILALAPITTMLASAAVFGAPSGTTPPPPPEDGTVRTAADVVSAITLAVEPVDYKGSFPVTVKFSGTVTVNRKCSLYYNWLRSDKPRIPARRINFLSAGTKTVQSSLSLTRPAQGWGTLFVWLVSQGATPKDVVYSNRVQYKAVKAAAGVATDQPPVVSSPTVAKDLPPVARITPDVKAVVTAAPADSPGPPPVDITFTSVVKTTGACTVKYDWVIDNKPSGVVKSLSFEGAGEKTVNLAHRVNRPWKGSAWLRISAPRQYESNRAQFMVRAGT